MSAAESLRGLIFDLADKWREAAAPTWTAESCLPLTYLNIEVNAKRDDALALVDAIEDERVEAERRADREVDRGDKESDRADDLQTALDKANDELRTVRANLEEALA